MPAPKLGARLTAGQQTLNLFIEVRILCPQLKLRLLSHPTSMTNGSFDLNRRIIYYFKKMDWNKITKFNYIIFWMVNP